MTKAEMRSDLTRVLRHAKAVARWLIALLIVLYLASGFYSVKPEQRGVVKRFGRVVTDNMLPGIHYHLPWPVESVLRLRTTEIRSMTVTFGETKGPEVPEVEGPQAESGSEAAQVEEVAEGSQVPKSTPLLTGDENLVLATLLIQYTITGPRSYLYHTADADGLLKGIVHEATVSRAAGTSVDELLTIGRLKVQTKLKEEIQAKTEAYDLGIRITSVQIQKIGPPTDVAGAFRDVTSAREDKHKLVQQARGDRNRRLPRARADANSMVSEAEAYAKEIVERAKGDAQRFTAAWSEYHKAKTVTAHRLYLEALEEILPKVRKMISNPEAERYIPPPTTHFSRDLLPPVQAGEAKKSELSSPGGGGVRADDKSNNLRPGTGVR
jgi:membrane protease subunit HflK